MVVEGGGGMVDGKKFKIMVQGKNRKRGKGKNRKLHQKPGRKFHIFANMF